MRSEDVYIRMEEGLEPVNEYGSFYNDVYANGILYFARDFLRSIMAFDSLLDKINSNLIAYELKLGLDRWNKLHRRHHP